MKWIPSQKIQSTLSPRLSALEYSKDYKFDFIEGDLVPNVYVQNLEAFFQKFIKVIISNNTPAINYGLFDLIPRSISQSEFECECEKLANAIVTHTCSDSKPDKPNGLGYSVERIYSISRLQIDSIDSLIVEANITGIDDIIEIIVPLVLVQDHL